ncbi:MAG: GtrA family protein [Lachnospiraceae bacterium]|nr:GtrA family protein [Lachnospiraceae bacterium]
MINSHKEVIFYLFWGVVTTIINWITYSVCVSFFRTSISTANIIAWVLAILVAYVSNKIWVFKNRSWAPATVVREFGVFLSARVFTGIIEVVGVPALVHFGLDQEIMGIKGAVSKVIVSVVVVILNYVFSKLFVFKKQ